jgi:hypothetical protein
VWRVLAFTSTPLPSAVSRLVVEVTRGGIQGTTSAGLAYSVVRVTGSDCFECFGVVGNGGGAFCIKKNCGFSFHGDAKISFQGIEEACYLICCGEGKTAKIG